MFKAPLLVGVAGVVIALAVTLASSASTTRAPVVRRIQATHMGRTAIQWYRIAQRRAEDRDWLQQRLGFRIRELLRLHRRFKAEPTRPPHYNEWLCIHSGEGGWTSNTGNGFYGGLQFTQGTWERNGGRKYASRADLATPLEQMWIAESAWRESGGGFDQWPTTARACGLL